MSEKDRPIPQQQGERIPPARRPPTAVAVDTPDPPERSLLRKIAQQLARIAMRVCHR